MNNTPSTTQRDAIIHRIELLRIDQQANRGTKFAYLRITKEIHRYERMLEAEEARLAALKGE